MISQDSREMFLSHSFKINRKWHILWSASINSSKSRKEDLVYVEKEYFRSMLGEQPLSRETRKQNGGFDEDIIDIISAKWRQSNGVLCDC